jgi:holo-[acyl-carrier protein] synthase
MILGIGNDITDIRRIEQTLQRFGDRFLDRVFTATERARSERRATRAASSASGLPPGGLRQGARHRIAPRRTGAYGRRQSADRAADAAAGRRRRQHLRLDADGHEARIDLTLTDDYPWAEAIVIISALPTKFDPR